MTIIETRLSPDRRVTASIAKLGQVYRVLVTHRHGTQEQRSYTNADTLLAARLISRSIVR